MCVRQRLPRLVPGPTHRCLTAWLLRADCTGQQLYFDSSHVRLPSNFAELCTAFGQRQAETDPGCPLFMDVAATSFIESELKNIWNEKLITGKSTSNLKDFRQKEMPEICRIFTKIISGSSLTDHSCR